MEVLEELGRAAIYFPPEADTHRYASKSQNSRIPLQINFKSVLRDYFLFILIRNCPLFQILLDKSDQRFQNISYSQGSR